MNRIIALIIAVVLCAGLTACGGVSQAEYDKLASENAELQSQIDEQSQAVETLQKEKTALQSEMYSASSMIDSLKEQVDFYKNGASNQLTDIRNAFEASQHEKVVSLASKLHSDFNGTPEDIEAQKLAEESQQVLSKIENEKKAEQERIAAELAKSEQEKARAIIRVTKIAVGRPNSAGGVDLFVGYKNMSDKTIKYATFFVTPYNSVGDSVSCTIRRNSTFGAKDEGPYEKNQGLAGNYNWYWQNAWYNWSISTVKLDRIYIQYMDGTTTTLTGKDLEYVQY